MIISITGHRPNGLPKEYGYNNLLMVKNKTVSRLLQFFITKIMKIINITIITLVRKIIKVINIIIIRNITKVRKITFVMTIIMV